MIRIILEIKRDSRRVFDVTTMDTSASALFSMGSARDQNFVKSRSLRIARARARVNLSADLSVHRLVTHNSHNFA